MRRLTVPRDPCKKKDISKSATNRNEAAADVSEHFWFVRIGFWFVLNKHSNSWSIRFVVERIHRSRQVILSQQTCNPFIRLKLNMRPVRECLTRSLRIFCGASCLSRVRWKRSLSFGDATPCTQHSIRRRNVNFYHNLITCKTTCPYSNSWLRIRRFHHVALLPMGQVPLLTTHRWRRSGVLNSNPLKRQWLVLRWWGV